MTNKISPIVSTILKRRGVETADEQRDFLEPDYTKTKHNPFLLLDMRAAVDRIIAAKKRGEKVTIYGDYDIDGMTATVVLWESLRKFGLEVETYTPDRFTEGYGLNVDAVEKIAADGTKLIITVDNGTLSFDEIARAKSLGVDVIVTDHHSPHDELPDAAAILNPKVVVARNPEEYDEKFCLKPEFSIRPASEDYPRRDNNLQLPSANELKVMIQKESPRIASKTDYFARNLHVFDEVKSLARVAKIDAAILENWRETSFDETIGRLADLTNELEKFLECKENWEFSEKNYQALNCEKKPQKSDLIFVFGSPSDLRIAKAVELYQQKIAPKIWITGSAPHFAKNAVSEAERAAKFAIENGVPREDIVIENQSIATPDNVKRSVDLWEKSGEKPRIITFVTGEFNLRRAEMDLYKFIDWDVELFGVASKLSGKITSRNWVETERGRRIILNEYAKLIIEQKIDQVLREKAYPFRDLCGVGVAFKLVQALQIESQKDADKFAKREKEIAKNHDNFKSEIVAKTLIKNRKTGKFLRLIRGKTHPKYALHRDFSGGIVEDDEDVFTAVAREIFEETNLKISGENLREIWCENFGDTTGILYFAEVPDVKNLKISWEHEKFEWLDLDEILDEKLPKNADPYYARAIKFLCQNREKLDDIFAKSEHAFSRNPYLIPFDDGQEKWLLDLVALGTVCDVVGLVDENRANVKWGLEVLKKTRRPGLRALLATANVDLKNVDARTLGFVIGPRLNAAGRLESAEYALELLKLYDDPENQAEINARALELAQKLDSLNKERRKVQDEIFVAAVQQIENETVIANTGKQSIAKKDLDCHDAKASRNDDDKNPVAIAVGDDWHEGVIGIVAAKILEKFEKPSFVLSRGTEFAKGSGRSFGEFSMAAAIHHTDTIIEKGGGHLAAGGLTVRSEKVDEWRAAIQTFYRSLDLKNQREFLYPKPDLTLMNFANLTTELLDEIAELEPFGQGNSAPIFEFVDVLILVRRTMGAGGEHVKYTFADIDGRKFTTVAFGAASKFTLMPFDDDGNAQHVTILVELMKNEWNGRTSVEGRLLRMEKTYDANNLERIN